MRVSIGPFPDTEHDRWPLVGCESISGVEIIPFSRWDSVPDADAVVYWSPEYQPPGSIRLEHPGQFKVMFLGDWHVNIPDLSWADLIATDYRGTKMLGERGIPESKILWWRGFSHDPRLHFPPEPAEENRFVDVSFMGRPTPHRLALKERLREVSGRIHFILDPYERGREAVEYRESKIVLGDSQRGELQMRAYEAMACGALYVCQMDTGEIWQAGAPIPTYQTGPGQLEAFLEAWLFNDEVRLTKVREQQAWVQRETPARHLAWLVERIKERMSDGNQRTRLLSRLPATNRAGTATALERDVAVPSRDHSVSAPVLRGAGVAVLEPPSVDEQRLECVALVPATAKRVLDVGCNKGGVLWALRQERPDLEDTCGLEMDADAARIARTRAHHVIETMVEPWLAELPDRFKGYFDTVLCLDVLEHLYDPWGVLGSLRQTLTRDGVVIASIPQIRNVANLYALLVEGRWEAFRHGTDRFEGPHCNVWSHDHIRFWTRKAITDLFEGQGYRIERWEASRLSAPGLEGFRNDLSNLIAFHGGDPEEWAQTAHVIQHIVVARPNWKAAT